MKPFGEIIYDKAEVEERIRRAQRAILSPDKPLRSFLEGPDEDDNGDRPPFLPIASLCKLVVHTLPTYPSVTYLVCCSCPFTYAFNNAYRVSRSHC